MEKRNTEKLGTILGFISGTVFILMGILWPIEWSNLALILGDSSESENTAMNILLKITRFLDLKSIFIVFGGTLSATFIAYPIKRRFEVLAVWGRFFLRIIQKSRRKKFTNRPGKLEKNVSTASV